jgi:hypothetical protein
MSHEPADIELKRLIGRWVAQWNEPSPDERRRLMTFGPDGRVRTDHQFVA